MKTKTLAMVLVGLEGWAVCVYATERNATTNVPNMGTAQVAESNNLQQVIRALPAIENLWSQQPGEYLRGAKQSLIILRDASDSPDVRQMALVLFDDVMNKSCPSNAEQSIEYFKWKSGIIESYYNEVRNDKARLLAIARYIGEVRSSRIPGYRGRGAQAPGIEILQRAHVRSPAALTNDIDIRDYQEAQEEYKRNNAMDRLQKVLESADHASPLLFYCARFSYRDPQNENFIEEIITAARLSEEESQQLTVDREPEVNEPIKLGPHGTTL